MKRALLPVLLFLNVYLAAQDTINLEPYFLELKTINLTLNSESYRFLFDAAAAQTFISPSVAEKAEIAGYGNSVIVRMHGEVLHYEKSCPFVLTSGKSAFKHESAGIWDVMSILPKELRKLDGVISLKSFADYKLVLDLSKNIIIVYKEDPPLTSSLLPSRFATGLEGTELNLFIGMPFNEKVYWFLFDSGNIGPMIFSKQTAEDLNLKTDNPEKSITILLGDKKEEVKYEVEDILYDGVLNYKLISNYRFLIDFAQEKIWLLE